MSAQADSLTIENVVASSDVGKELALDELATDLPGAQYNKDQFPGLIYRTQDPKAAALVFRSGKVVCTGANSVDDVEEALTKLFGEFRDLDIPVDELEYTVQNVVSSGDLGSTLNLNAIAIGLGLESVEYEPEQFPGLVYRLDEPDVVALLFGSGKVVITGGKSPDDAGQALDVLREELGSLGLLG